MESLKVKLNIPFLFINIVFVILILILSTMGVSVTNLLSIVIGYVGIFALVAPAISKDQEAISVLNLTPFMFMMYALGPLKYKDFFSSSIVNEYLILQMVGIFSLILGFKSIKSYKINNTRININKIDLSSLKISAILFLILSLISVLTEVIAFGGISGLLASGYGLSRIEIINSSRIIGGGFQWLILSSVILGYTGYKLNSKVYKLLGLVLFVFSFIILFFTGGRSTVVYTAIFILVMYHYDIKKIKLKNMIVFIFLGIIVSQLYSNARYYLPEGFVSTISNTMRIFLNDPKSFLPLPENISEFQIPAKSLLDILERGEELKFYGKSYIHALGTPFPIVNRLLLGFGINIAEWFLFNYHFEIFESGAGLGFSPVTEGYLNFRYFGVAIHMYVYGLIGAKIHQMHKKSNNIFTLLLYAGVMPMLILEGLRIHLSSALYKVFRIYLFPFILYCIVKYLIQPLKNKSKES